MGNNPQTNKTANCSICKEIREAFCKGDGGVRICLDCAKEQKLVICDICDSLIEKRDPNCAVQFPDGEIVEYFYCQNCENNDLSPPDVSPYPKDQLVYFIKECSSGCIKIGFTKEIEKRLATLNTANPGEINLLLSVPGDKKEKALHRKFSIYRKKGEWFYPCKELLTYIKAEKKKMNPL